METTRKELSSIIDFSNSNNFVNNLNKAALLYNSGGIGSEWDQCSAQTENWTTEENKTENPFWQINNYSWGYFQQYNKIWHRNICKYLIPIFEKEDLKAHKLSNETSSLQTIQNTTLRVIRGLRMVQCVNMQRLREKIKMISGNQMAV